MATEPEITTLSPDAFDKDPKGFLAHATPGHIIRVFLPSGSITVLMSERDFESYKPTSEILSNPARAEAIRQELTELEK